MPGVLYGVGVGPGDSELITEKALRVLNSVDVIVAPKSKGAKESLALSVVKGKLEKKSEVVELEFPMTKDPAVLEKAWEDAVEKTYLLLSEGKDVAFPTIGDPLFYSTFIYVMRGMQGRHPEVEVKTIPGVTALSACAVELGAPLGEGDERIAILPASYGIEDIREVALRVDTIVLMKVSRNYDVIVRELEKAGLKEKAVLVTRCGTEEYSSSPLDAAVGGNVDYFSMIIIRGARS
ncbi:MAG: precorrin-2 C(20)-methyltransferase [Candidatus Hydrothermarchaeales archaeon]